MRPFTTQSCVTWNPISHDTIQGVIWKKTLEPFDPLNNNRSPYFTPTRELWLIYCQWFRECSRCIRVHHYKAKSVCDALRHLCHFAKQIYISTQIWGSQFSRRRSWGCIIAKIWHIRANMTNHALHIFFLATLYQNKINRTLCKYIS